MYFNKIFEVKCNETLKTVNFNQLPPKEFTPPILNLSP